MNSISALGTIFGIWAHPDDETFMIGGLLAMAGDAGQQTICVTATKGEKGGSGDVRVRELADALAILGVSEQQYLGYQDGSCADVDDTEAVTKLSALIEQYKPDSIITFAGDGLTGHSDHQAVSRWATTVAAQHNLPVFYAVHTRQAYDNGLKQADKLFNIYFATDQPVLVSEIDCNLLVKLEPSYLERKLQALEAMPSQYRGWFQKLSEDELANIFSTEALIAAK